MKKYRVLITDGLDPVGIDLLKTHPEIHFDLHSGLSASEVRNLLPTYHAVIVGASPIDAASIEASKDLGLIMHTGPGSGAIDLRAARAKNISVRNTKGAQALSVAEFAIGSLLSLARSPGRVGVELHGKVLGVFGLGMIGKIVAEKAMALGMQVIAYDPFISSISMLPNKFKMLEMRFTLTREPYEVFLHADFLSLHVSKTQQPVIGAREIEKLKDGVFLLNLSDESAIDAAAVKSRVASGKIAAFSEDLQCIAGNTKETAERVAAASAEMVLQFFNSGMKREVLN